MSEQRKIYTDSPEAATPVQATVYRDVTGKLWIDESSARYWSANTSRCRKCGADCSKGYTLCNGCKSLDDLKRYESMPVEKWDGKAFLCTYDDDRYFFDADDAAEYVFEKREAGEVAMLCLCEPDHYRQLDADYWCDNLPEDGEIPDELEAAVDVLNNVIQSLPPSCYRMGKKRIDVDAEFPNENGR